MSQRMRWLLALTVSAAFLGLLSPVTAGETRKPAAESLNDLNLEVEALQTLHALQATRPQMQKLRSLARQTADKPPVREAAKASEKFRKSLAELRDALAANRDDERINKLTDKLDQLRNADKPELDDDIDITEEAREQAPKLLRMLTAGQVAGYLGSYADTIGDPLGRIQEALEKVRGLKDKEWKETRDQVCEDVGELVAGLDGDKATEVSDRVRQLLIMARGLRDEEFKKERPGLERMARRIVGDLGPTDVLRHVMERHLAELLSNPRLSAALEARLKSETVRKR
ncbi:MAG TPA: hypothetical protein VG013_42740 [Gemmataceae bacterium]|nr:hypothetical protein [Gemmataceae bacterium]